MKRLLLFFLILWPSVIAAAHGAEYSILSDRVMKIEAIFDTGEPFATSPVLVFPPGQSEAEYTLETDVNGIFYFSPDRAGTWILQVRGEEGHGLRINIPVDENMVPEKTTGSGFSLFQRIVMTLCVLWGAAGTALYFRKRR